ncbi:MAG TPA: SGNH/GDSL hydrolase family protein [Anaerolineales bacterium]|nr:SGNH/GDSL hydrolase family protein [Anaerolineales bacterium]
MQQAKPRIRLFPVLLKAMLLFVLFNIVFIFIKDIRFGNLSLYNSIFPGRERLPFGETRESYNLSLFNLDAMFASHVVAGTEKTPDEYRVLLIGDSSVWGTLLMPEKTLAGQLNANAISACGKTIHAYNLGYPTISLMKDLMILDQAKQYQPDMVIWLTTLEAFPNDKQLTSPIVANNAERVRQLITNYELPMNENDPALVNASKWEQTFVSQRRAVADLLRLQIYGALWASTGIDQVYPENYERAQTDLAANDDFHGLTSLQDALALDVLDAGMSIPADTLLVNEPMLISDGLNSDIRYNFFYPRWAYDEYRQLLAEHAAARNWHYLDLWDLVPAAEFTNSAIHLTPAGETLLANEIAEAIQTQCK